MDLLPWRFLNRKYITRDLLLMIDQFDAMYEERKKIKEHKDQVAKDQMQFRPFQAQSTTSNSNRAKSVL